MKISDIRKLDLENLTSKLKDLKDEEFNFKIQLSTQQSANYKQYYKTKRTIARVKTIMTELQKKRAVNKS